MKKTCLFASITTFGGYLKVHIPRGLGISTILYGVCGVMCSMPFFLQDRSLYALSSSSSSATENGTFTRRGGQIPMCDTLNSSLNAKSDSCSVTDDSAGEYLNITLTAPIATKVVCCSRLLKCLRSLYGKQCGPRSDCSYRSSL